MAALTARSSNVPCMAVHSMSPRARRCHIRAESIEKFKVQVIEKRISVARRAQARVAALDETSSTNRVETATRKRVDTPVDVRIEGSTNRFTCEPDDTLLRAALRSDIGFPYEECNSGSRQLHVSPAVSGAIHDLWPDAPGLSASARAATPSRVSVDAAIELRYSDARTVGIHCSDQAIEASRHLKR